jgi:hypothetical protein
MWKKQSGNTILYMEKTNAIFDTERVDERKTRIKESYDTKKIRNIA